MRAKDDYPAGVKYDPKNDEYYSYEEYPKGSGVPVRTIHYSDGARLYKLPTGDVYVDRFGRHPKK